MKTPLKILIITLGSIGALWIVGRLTNAIQFYRLPTQSNEPTLMQGSYFFSSNLKKPERFDFICYNFYDGISKTVFVKRLCGISGDTLEIRNGDLFVNNKSVDHLFSLYHRYFISEKDLKYLMNKRNFDMKNLFEGPNQEYNDGDSIFTVFLSKELAADKNIKVIRNILPKDSDPGLLSKDFDSGWNRDNFGPIVIPKGLYFVLGDSRENSEDSRYTGFINESDWIGTVLR